MSDVFSYKYVRLVGGRREKMTRRMSEAKSDVRDFIFILLSSYIPVQSIATRALTISVTVARATIVIQNKNMCAGFAGLVFFFIFFFL